MKISNYLPKKAIACRDYFFILIVILGAYINADAAINANAAYDLLTQRTTAVRNAFYIYQDVDSSLNHGFLSGLSGDTQSINLNLACINDTFFALGCSADTNALDRQRGTVLKILFGAQVINPDVGLKGWAAASFVEPINWFTSQSGKGYDLRGVQELVFDVRSPSLNNFNFKFGMAGHSILLEGPKLGFSTVRVPICYFGLTQADLANVHELFTIAVDAKNAPIGGIVIVDNIRFEPPPTNQQQSGLGLPLSTQTFGAQIPQTPVPPDQANRNVATIYESALTLMAFLDRGNNADLDNARLIADALHYALSHENHGDFLPPFPNGSLGLHNGYSSGDLALFNGQGKGAGQEGDIRIAGFSSSNCSPSNYCVMLDGATGGNNAFALLGLISAYNRFQDIRYLDDARQIGNWIINQLFDSSSSGFGGYFLGYPDEGAAPPKPLQKGKSVENNADIFAALSALASIEKQLGNTEQANHWNTYANYAGDFVMQMYDSTRGCFFAGTVPIGSGPGAGVKPDGLAKGNDIINTYDFFDSNSFTILAMAGSPRYAKAIDWRMPTQCLIDKFALNVNAANLNFSGFNIEPATNGIAWEFTGQAVKVMNYVGQLYNDTRFASQASLYQEQIAQAQAAAPFTDGLGLVASTLPNGDNLPPVSQCLNTPFQCIPERVGLAATTWAIFAANGSNPLVRMPNPYQTECLFNWAEKQYNNLFIPFGSKTEFSGIYTYRQYPISNSILRVSSNDNHVYYQGSDGKTQDVGPIMEWLPKLECVVPPPMECLFNWAERNYSGLFSPFDSATQFWNVYNYRYYSATKVYLGVSSLDNHVYYVPENGQMQDEGPISFWLPKADCQFLQFSMDQKN